MHHRRPIALAISVAISLAACASPTSGPSATPAGSVAGPPAPSVPPTCAVTIPTPAFTAPSPFPGQPPAVYGAAWFGSRALWTMLPPGGDIWSGLPRDKVGYTQKTFWWSADWDPSAEPTPAISLTGRQLDGPATLIAEDPTNATADLGASMLVGVVLPSPGCWQITARYRGAELSYVVWVDGN